MHVRVAFVAVALAVGISFVAACGQTASPTSPASPFLARTSQSLTTSSVDQTPPPDESLPIDNPCTGSSTTATVHWIKYVSRSETDATGGQHTTITGVIQLSTSDGFSGRGAVHFTGAEDPGGQEFEIDVEINSAVVGNGTGQRILVHLRAVNVRREGITFVQFETSSLECVGRP
jgi:hypothetical protein